MATERTGATGSMQLSHEHEEPASTQWERFLKVSLEASKDGQHIRLTERHHVKDSIDASNNEHTMAGYEVSVSELIGYIKKHGKPVRSW